MPPENNDNRLSAVERDSRDHAKSLTALVDEIGAIKAWLNQQDILSAREDERDKSLYRRLDEIEGSVEASRNEAQAGIKEIKSAWSRIQWMIIGLVISAAVAWVLKGNLAG